MSINVFVQAPEGNTRLVNHKWGYVTPSSKAIDRGIKFLDITVF